MVVTKEILFKVQNFEVVGCLQLNTIVKINEARLV